MKMKSTRGSFYYQDAAESAVARPEALGADVALKTLLQRAMYDSSAEHSLAGGLRQEWNVRQRRRLILLAICGSALLLRPADPSRVAPPPFAKVLAGRQASRLLASADRMLHEGDGRRAQESYRRALTLAERAGDRRQQAAALLGLGDCAKPHAAEKLRFYERSLALCDPRQRDRVAARALYARGIRDMDRGDLARGRDRFMNAYRLAQRAGDERLGARLLVALGNVAGSEGNEGRAEECYRKALRFGEKTRDRRMIVTAAKNLGDCYGDRGESVASLAHYDRALVVARELGDRNEIANALNAIGTIYLGQGDYARAHRDFQAVLRLNPEDRLKVGFALNNLGIILSLQGDDQLALDYYSQSFAILESLAKADASRVLTNIGLTYQGRRAYDRATAYLYRALALAQESGDGTPLPANWYSIGSLREEQGLPILARQAFERSLELAEKREDEPGIGQALLGLARLRFASGRSAPAIELADRAAAIASKSQEREMFWQARALTGRALIARGRRAAAREALDQAILTIEEERSRAAGSERIRQGFFTARLVPYRSMVSLLASQGDASGALAYAERAKGRALLDLVQSRGKARSPAAETTQEVRLRDRLVALNEQVFLERRAGRAPERLRDLAERLSRARLDLEAFRIESYATQPQLRRRADPRTWTTRSSGELTPNRGTAFLEYVVTDEQTILMTLLPRSNPSGSAQLQVHAIAIHRKDLVAAVEDFHRLLADRRLDFESAAQRLYRILLYPVRSELRGIARLCIVPDGPLWNLPFQALETAPGQYLLERYAISYTPSLGLLVELQRGVTTRSALSARGSVPGPLLAMGDPALSPARRDRAGSALASSLTPLPDAAQEVREIGRLYGSGSRVATGADASEQAAKSEARRYRVLHFATHSVLDDRSPMYSYLVLSQARADRREDGLLEAWEIMDLDLDADLVVLSACQTARGRVGEGEGVIGLSWAFFAAGARAVVASQWPVDSAATRRLMVEFHRGLSSGLTRAEALRQAALATRADTVYQHPYYWAGFVLLGDPGQ